MRTKNNFTLLATSAPERIGHWRSRCGKLNPLGSSVAVDHPFAATGARIVTTLANELKRRDARYCLVSICGAGATVPALILERG